MNYKLRTINNEPQTTCGERSRTINNELRSIKIERLCKTNPISEMLKTMVNLLKIITNNKKQRTMNCQKQTQTKPIYKVGQPMKTHFIKAAICLNWGCSAVPSNSNNAISTQLIWTPSSRILSRAICLFSNVLDDTASAITLVS